MSADRKLELLARIRAAPSPTRAQHRARSLVAAAIAVAIMVALFLALGGFRPGGASGPDVTTARPVALVLISSIGAAVLALAALWALVSRGGSMLGRGRGHLAVSAAVIVAALVGWKVGASAGFADMTLPWPTRPGFRCLGVGLLLGAWPLAAMIAARGRSDAVHPTWTGAGLGVAAGTCTWVLVDLWCPVGYLPHILLGHVLPIVFLAALGAWIGSRWVAVRA